MKYIIVGLGNFGISIAKKLTEQGNEVIGIDRDLLKVDAYKEKISHTIQIDATDEYTMSGLPLKTTDIAIVAIGEDQGANVMATAVLKNLKVKKLISRSINPLHEKILQAIGVDAIVRPEEESAERWAKKLNLRNVVDTFALSEEYSIIEAEVPQEYIGKKLGDLNIRKNFNLVVLTTIIKEEADSFFGKSKTINKVRGVATRETLLNEGDILVLYGSNKDLNKFLKNPNSTV